MRILIIKTSAIGDVIAALDALSYLHFRLPTATIDWVVEKGGASLLQAHPHLHRALVCDTKKWRKAPFSKENREEMKRFYRELRSTEYDVLFDLQGNTKSAIMTALARARDKVGFSFGTAPEKPNALVTNRRFRIPRQGAVRKQYLDLIQAYFSDALPFAPQPVRLHLIPEERVRLEKLLTEAPRGPKLMCALGSNWKNKQLSPATVKEVLRLIDREISPLFFFPYGSEAEKERSAEWAALFPERGVAVGEMSLPFWQALIAEMTAVVTMDSAALHLCHTTATPSFSLFGPSLAAAYKPPGEGHVALQGECPFNTQFSMRCPKLRTCTTGACMHTYTAEEIARAFMQAYARWKVS